MCGEFAAVIRGYRVNELPVREKQSGHDFGRRQSLASALQLLHQNEVGGTLRERDNGVAARVHDGVHLPIAEACAVRLLGTVVDACAVGYVCGLGGACRLDSPGVLQFMRHMLRKTSAGVSVHVVVDGLSCDMNTLLAQHSGNLRWRPVLFLYHLLDTPP